jgi:alkylresorcinol/alkylpyrone synthase
VSGRITGFGSAFPPAMTQPESWEGFFADHYSDSRRARLIWRNAGVDRRHCAVDPRSEDLSRASTGTRMQRFGELAVPLGCDAVAASLASAGVDARDVDLFTVVSCTGYATPGVDQLVSRGLGMSGSLQRLHVGHMGCYAALPGLAAVADAATARAQIGVLLCVELTSLHIQPATDDVEQIVAHSLFSDAAAAVTVVPDGRGLEVVDMVARTAPDTADLMTWHVTDLGFRMRLSPKVPAVLNHHVLDATEDLLRRNDLTVADVRHWAVHPGGPRIVDAVARTLDLSDDDVAASRDVLREHGNCSSATTLLVLQQMVEDGRMQRGDHAVAMAFGPGLTLYCTLLRVR